jgi:hypothetical protein
MFPLSAITYRMDRVIRLHLRRIRTALDSYTSSLRAQCKFRRSISQLEAFYNGDARSRLLNPTCIFRLLVQLFVVRVKDS